MASDDAKHFLYYNLKRVLRGLVGKFIAIISHAYNRRAHNLAACPHINMVVDSQPPVAFKMFMADKL